MLAFFKFRSCGAAQPFQQSDAQMGHADVFLWVVQHFSLKVLIVKRV